jgi:hypothetical protein
LYGVWLVVAALFYLAAVWSYNRRKSELSEQAQPQGVLQMIAKCFAGFCGAALFYAIFSEVNNAFTVILTSLFGALLIGLLAELILSRGVRSVKRNLIWLAGSGLLFVVMVFGVRADLVGYVNRVPEASAVESVSINYGGRFDQLEDNYGLLNAYNFEQTGSWNYSNPGVVELTDPESIAIITDAHRRLVGNKPDRTGSFSGYFESSGGWDYNSQWLRIDYKLANGSTLSRNYQPIYSEAYRMLSQLETQEEFIRKNSVVFLMDDLFGEGKAAEWLDTISVYYSYDNGYRPYHPTADESAKILDAVRQDMLAETYEELVSPTAPAFGYLRLEFQYQVEPERFETAASTVILGPDYTNTVNTLKELGMWDDEPLREVAEVRFVQDYIPTDVVYPLQPGYTDGAQYSNYDPPLPSVTDPAEIAAVLAAAKDQMLLIGGETGYHVAYFDADGAYIGGQMILLDDVPESVRGEVMERFGINGDASDYPIFAEYAYPQHTVTSVTLGDAAEIAVA